MWPPSDLKELAARKVDVLAIDTAHAHTARVMDAVRNLKRALPGVELITGNVATFRSEGIGGAQGGRAGDRYGARPHGSRDGRRAQSQAGAARRGIDHGECGHLPI